MSELPIPMSLPLDEDGFLRRECPNCERQFKWWPTPPSEESLDKDAQEAVEAYFCPYCHEPAAPNAWWTKEQVEYAQQLAAAKVLGPQLRRFKSGMESRNRRSRGIRFDVSLPSLPQPESLTEPALHQKSGLNTRSGRSTLNKLLFIVVACNFGAKPTEPNDMVRIDVPCHPEEPLKVDEERSRKYPA